MFRFGCWPPTYVECGDGLVLTRLQLSHGVCPAHHLVGDRVVDSIVAVLHVLVRQLPGDGHLVPVRALGAAVAGPLGEEGADRGFVALRRRRGGGECAGGRGGGGGCRAN